MLVFYSGLREQFPVSVQNSLIWLWLAVGLSLAVAWLSYNLWEARFLRLKDKLAGRRGFLAFRRSSRARLEATLRTEARKGGSLKVPLAVLFIAVAAGLFMYRASLLPILDAISETTTDFLETHIGLTAPVHIAMSVYGTIAARVVLLVLLVGVISGLALLLRKVTTGRVWAVAVLAAAAAVYLLVFYLLPPLSLEDGGPISWRRVIVGAAFACTALFAGLWIVAAWLAGRLRVPAQSALLGSFLVALVSASAVASLVPHGYRLHQLTDLVFHDDAVSIVLDANVNGIYINDARRRLYATGNGSERVFAFSLDDLSAPPLLGQEGSGGSESLAFNEKDNEIYVFGNQSLRVLDADSLRISGDAFLSDGVAGRRPAHVGRGDAPPSGDV